MALQDEHPLWKVMPQFAQLLLDHRNDLDDYREELRHLAYWVSADWCANPLRQTDAFQSTPVYVFLSIPQKRSWSPVAALFSERSTPELLYQEIRWASFLSYGVTVKLLSDLLPMEHLLSTSAISRHVHQVAERLEGELVDKQTSFIEGCPDQWSKLPEPAAPPLVVSLDGGYVHARSSKSRKDGSFEVIVGKSTTGEGATTRFGLVC